MASPKDHVICHVCGFKNDPGAERCVSCGAKLEELSGSYTIEEEGQRRPTRKGFAIQWAVVSFLVYIVLQSIVLVGLPVLIDEYDPQGFSALLISIAVWFVGGTLVGFISPGKTFIEPAVGALFAIVPTVWWLVYTTPEAPERLGGGFQLNMPAYVIGGLLGGMISLFGAFLGERLSDRKKPT
jgi:hypothetical protein